IPGVPGIGEKTALALIQGVGGLNALYTDLEAVRGLAVRGAKTLPEKLLEHKEMAYLSYQLATIKTDVELALTPQQIHIGEPDKQRLLALYKEMESRSWVAELDGHAVDTSSASTGFAKGQPQAPLQAVAAPASAPVLEVRYDTLLTEETFDAWLVRLETA